MIRGTHCVLIIPFQDSCQEYCNSIHNNFKLQLTRVSTNCRTDKLWNSNTKGYYSEVKANKLATIFPQFNLLYVCIIIKYICALYIIKQYKIKQKKIASTVKNIAQKQDFFWERLGNDRLVNIISVFSERISY